MVALTAARVAPKREGLSTVAPMAANIIIYGGALVVMDGAVAKAGVTAAGLVALGIAEETVSNLGGAAGAARVLARRGTYLFDNLAADAVTAAELGKDCYIVDDQTVAKGHSSNTRSIAGKVIDVEPAGVWVRVGH